MKVEDWIAWRLCAQLPICEKDVWSVVQEWLQWRSKVAIAVLNTITAQIQATSVIEITSNRHGRGNYQTERLDDGMTFERLMTHVSSFSTTLQAGTVAVLRKHISASEARSTPCRSPNNTPMYFPCTQKALLHQHHPPLLARESTT